MANAILRLLKQDGRKIQLLTTTESIDSKSIAILDEKNALTTNEVDLAQRIVKNTGELFGNKDKIGR